MKVLFLDIDGCLNSGKYIRSLGKPFGTTRTDEILDPSAIDRLNRLVEATGAAVVVSSAWRIGSTAFGLQCVLQRHGFQGEVIDITPHSAHGVRGREIQEWLNRNPEVKSFAILDDANDMEHLLPFLVRTNYDSGLLDSHVEDLIKILEVKWKL